MSPLSPVPDPSDAGPGPGPASPPAAAPDPAQPQSVLRRLLGRGAAGHQRGTKFSSPFQPQVATPAPKGYAREEPAVDVDEHQSRSTQYRNPDAVDVEATKLRCLNAWIRTRKLLFEGDPDADEPERRQPLLARERFGIQKLAQVSDAAARARERVQDRAGARARRDAVERASRLTHRAMEVEYRLNTITDEIDSAARRVHDEVAGIIGHFWLELEQRAEQDRDLVGIWRTREAARTHGEIAFAAEFGAPPIPSVEEIERLIKAARERYARASAQRSEPSA
jgi:hypothetical protein